MATYTKLDFNDIQFICAQYDLIPITFDPIRGGQGNSSFLVKTAKEDYILTVFDDKSFDYVLNLTRLLTLLVEHDFPTTHVIPLRNGNLALEYVGKPVILKKYIRGDVTLTIDQTMMQQIGAAMGVLHNIPAPDYLPREHEYGRQLFPSIIGRNINPAYESWLAQQVQKFNTHLPTTLPTGLIHGDLFYDNILFQGNQFAAIIDFEQACCYYNLFDLGMTLVGTCTNGMTLDLAHAHAFIAGYQQHHPLTTVEKEAIQLFVEYAATATSYWRFWKYNIDTPMPENANKHQQMVAIAQQTSAMPPAEFLATLFHA